MKRLLTLAGVVAALALTVGAAGVLADEEQGTSGGDQNSCLAPDGGDHGDVNNANHDEGTTGDDNIEGTEQGDVENGQAGDDELDGNNGDDNLNGGPGNDDICGDQGDDVENGGPGNDDLDGGAGTDTPNGGPGAGRLPGD